MDISKYKNFLSFTKAKKEIYQTKKESLEFDLSKNNQYKIDLTTAEDIMNIVGTVCQQQTKDVLESLVTEAFQCVFGDNYSFLIENHVSRNQPETEMFAVIDGVKRKLGDDTGGGLVDVASFVLRIVIWAISLERTEPFIFLDEPIRNNLDVQRKELMAEMIKSLSTRLGIQLVMITKEEDDFLKNIADKIWHVKKVDGISQVEEIVEKIN